MKQQKRAWSMNSLDEFKKAYARLFRLPPDADCVAKQLHLHNLR